MANEMFTQLPTVANALSTDIICAVQGYVSPSSPGTSVQETLGQVMSLASSTLIANFAGNPNGNVAGTTYNLCWDTTHLIMYVCTTSGSAASAIWTEVGGVGEVITAAEGGTGVSSPTAHTLPIAEGSSNFNFVGPLTNGQLLIGSTGADPIAASITAGTNISVSNGAGSITIAATGLAGIGWNNVTTTSATMVADAGYLANNAGLVTLTLPATAAFGTITYIQGFGAGGWTIAQGSGQSIKVGSVSSTTGAGGSVSSTNQYDSITLFCAVANTTWCSLGGPQGNLTIV